MSERREKQSSSAQARGRKANKGVFEIGSVDEREGNQIRIFLQQQSSLEPSGHVGFDP